MGNTERPAVSGLRSERRPHHERGGSLRGKRALFAVLLLSNTLAGAAENEPRPVSPGRIVGVPSLSSACPVFTFTEAQGALGYDLVVLRIPFGAEENDLEGATVALRVELPAGASAWSPPLDQCLETEASYIWSVRARLRADQGAWSRPARFEVPLSPTATELEWALEILDRHRRAEQSRREPASEPSAERSESEARARGVADPPRSRISAQRTRPGPTARVARPTTTAGGGFRVEPFVTTLTKSLGFGTVVEDLSFAILETLCADGDGCELRLFSKQTAGVPNVLLAKVLLFLDEPSDDQWRVLRLDKEELGAGTNGNSIQEALIELQLLTFSCGVYDDGEALFPTYQLQLQDDDAAECLLRIDD